MYTILGDTLRIAIGLLFGASAVTKIWQPRQFIAGVAQYGLVRPRVAPPVAIAVMIGEISASVALVTGVLWFVGAIIGLVLLLVFAVAVTINLRRNRSVPCHCFGTSTTDTISARTLTRIVLLLTGIAFVIILLGPVDRLQRSMGADAFLTATATAIGILVCARWLFAIPQLYQTFFARRA